MQTKVDEHGEWVFTKGGASSVWYELRCHDGACPECLKAAGIQFEPMTEPTLPLEGCTCEGECRAYYVSVPFERWWVPRYVYDQMVESDGDLDEHMKASLTAEQYEWRKSQAS